MRLRIGLLPLLPAFCAALATPLLSTPDAIAAVPGPLRVSRDGRHFVDKAGKPFFWLGDTAWPLLVEYPKPVAEAYLVNRAKKGFTAVNTVIAWTHGGSGYEKELFPMANVAGVKPWTNDNPATPNDAFFQHVDHLVRFADQQGIVLVIMPTWGYYVRDSKVVDAKNARAYGRWLGARYKAAPNIIWSLGGDRIPSGVEAVWREMAAGLRQGHGGAHLMSYHPSGWRSSAQFFHDEPWLSFNMIQTWSEWSKVYPAVTADALLTPRKPVVLSEGAYEAGPEYPHGPITPLLVRRQAWWTVMAGGFHTYGHTQSWRMDKGWETLLDSAGAVHVARMREILTARAWWDLWPYQGLFAGGVGSEGMLNAAMLAKNHSWGMAYVASQTNVILHLDRIEKRRVKVTLVNPVDGKTVDRGTHDTGNFVGGWPKPTTLPIATPGFWEDAVILLEGVD